MYAESVAWVYAGCVAHYALPERSSLLAHCRPRNVTECGVLRCSTVVDHIQIRCFVRCHVITLCCVHAVVPANAKALQTTFTQACHNIRPALDAIMKGRGTVAAIQQLGMLAFVYTDFLPGKPLLRVSCSVIIMHGVRSSIIKEFVGC